MDKFVIVGPKAISDGIAADCVKCPVALAVAETFCNSEMTSSATVTFSLFHDNELEDKVIIEVIMVSHYDNYMIFYKANISGLAGKRLAKFINTFDWEYEVSPTAFLAHFHETWRGFV